MAQAPAVLKTLRTLVRMEAAGQALKNALLGMMERADEREALEACLHKLHQQLIDMPVEIPDDVGAQEPPGAVVSTFLQCPDTPSGLGGRSPSLVFNRVNDAIPRTKCTHGSMTTDSVPPLEV